jgi:hypothetical protein
VTSSQSWTAAPASRQFPVQAARAMSSDHANPAHHVARRRPRALPRLLHPGARHEAAAAQGLPRWEVHAGLRGVRSRGDPPRPGAHLQLGHLEVRARQRLRPCGPGRDGHPRHLRGHPPGRRQDRPRARPHEAWHYRHRLRRGPGWLPGGAHRTARPRAGAVAQPTRSIRPSACLANRPSPLGWTGPGLGQGQPPNSVRR